MLSAAAGASSRPTLKPSLQLKQFCLFLFPSSTSRSTPSLSTVLNFITAAQRAGLSPGFQPDQKPASRHRYGDCTGFGEGACKREPRAAPRSPTFTAQLHCTTPPTSCRDSYRLSKSQGLAQPFSFALIVLLQCNEGGCSYARLTPQQHQDTWQRHKQGEQQATYIFSCKKEVQKGTWNQALVPREPLCLQPHLPARLASLFAKHLSHRQENFPGLSPRLQSRHLQVA